MTPIDGNRNERGVAGKAVLALAMAVGLAVQVLATPALQAQSGSSQTQSDPPTKAQPTQDIPDAPSAVQPPPKPAFPEAPPGAQQSAKPARDQDSQSQADEQQPAPPPMPPIETLPPGSAPRNQINPNEQLPKFVVSVNFVQVPVLVEDASGRRVDGLLPKDFTVLENGKKQTLTYFTSDPFELSVAFLIDIGMPDVAVQKVNQTYSALVAALSPYDEAAIYTYSSTVSQVTDFTRRTEKLTSALDQIKSVRGHNNGPAVLTGPLSGGPTVNGAPVGGPTIQPVNTPPKEAHVLNDAILRAAMDLSKRDKTRRKVILVISDGRELGSQASYRDVLRVLESRDVQVKAVVVDSGALPMFRQIERFHLPGQGYSDILRKYTYATGGGQVITELTRNGIEDAYAEITSQARNQYTLGYIPAKTTTGGSAYRSIEVLVDRKRLKIFAKDGYYPAPLTR
jgi:VWFA-related protein